MKSSILKVEKIFAILYNTVFLIANNLCYEPLSSNLISHKAQSLFGTKFNVPNTTASQKKQEYTMCKGISHVHLLSRLKLFHVYAETIGNICINRCL